METSNHPTTRTRNRLMAAAASVAIAGAIGLGAVTTGTAPVLAEAVRVEGVQNPGFADVVEQVSPAVVSVRVQSRIEPASDNGADFGMRGFENLPRDHPLYHFFRQFRDRDHRSEDRFRERRREHRARPVSQGSGFFISQDGYLVTNNHVVQGGTEFTVILDDGDEYEAELVGTDPRTDLAVLKVNAEDEEFTYVNFADDNEVRVGEWVVAVGNPFGLGGTVTAGIVSARGRDIGAGPYDDFLQIDAAVNRGNSGGPAFNLSGEVVGVNTAIFSPSGGNVGIAFAIPASTARNVVASLVQNGSVLRGWLGVQIQAVTDDIAESLGLDKAGGALVSEVQADSPALEAGIEVGDVITAVGENEIESPRELARVIGGFEPDRAVEVTVLRNGSEEKLDIKLGELPPMDRTASAESPDGSAVPGNTLEDFGLTVAPADDGNGLVVTDVAPMSLAAERGLEAGDVIVAVNSKGVSGPDDVTRAVEEAAKAGRSAVLVQISRDDNNRFVALPIDKG